MFGSFLLIRIGSLVLLLFLSFFSQGQLKSSKAFSEQLTLITDNDRYLLQGKDRYYTNGLMFHYSRVVTPEKTSVIKRVDQYELGQKLFTPFSRKIYVIEDIDRPVTGYLYAKYTRSNFIQNNQLWQWGASIGTIGEASLGQDMQNTFHKIINVNSDWWGWIWQHQLKSEPGFNLHARYARGLINNNNHSLFQITPVSHATLGTSFTNFSQGLLLQIGKFNQHLNSAYWNASVQDKQTSQSNQTELFFYYYPEAMYQVYNATVQGGMFRKDKGMLVSSIEPFVMTHQVGALFSMHRYTVRLEATFQTKEAKSQRFAHDYGTIAVSYRFN